MPFTAPLTEPESHHFSVEIEESTGYEIGWKTLKNYSQYLLAPQGRLENPSTPTLDALARYVADATATPDAGKQPGRRHYAYWFRYKEASQHPPPLPQPPQPAPTRSTPSRGTAALVAVAVGAVLLVLVFTATSRNRTAARPFTDEFTDVGERALAERGWAVLSIDTVHWAARGRRAGHLTLFTLQGDNWPQPGVAPRIKNLLVRKASSDCFVADVRLSDFFPKQNWQQAGLLLLDDTTFTGKSLRLSLGYNDFAGGFPGTREIIVQAVTSLGRGDAKPEEIAHQRLFVLEPGSEALIAQNLNGAALRIEKRGTHVRLLYSVGAMPNAAFKEVTSTEFAMRAAYIGVFALKGVVSHADDMPVYVDGFSLSAAPCAGR